MELSAKTALVTGAGSGIGRASAIRFAAEGATVGLLGRTEDDLVEAGRAIEAAGGRAVVLVADVADEAAMTAAVDRLVAETGRIDVVFANAGINGVWAPIDELTLDEWEKTLSINLTGTYLTIRLTVPHLARAGGGAILVTSSINGTRTFSNTGATAYAVTKAGQVAMVGMLAPELARRNIRINAICPGAIETDISDSTTKRHLETARMPAEYPEGQIPLTGTREGTAEQVAELALFLVSDRSSHVTGTPVWIDGGQSLIV